MISTSEKQYKYVLICQSCDEKISKILESYSENLFYMNNLSGKFLRNFFDTSKIECGNCGVIANDNDTCSILGEDVFKKVSREIKINNITK